MSEIRVRFAPSPTGALHIGGVRTALYNYLFAKKNGGKFIIRIEDTDQTRFVPGAEEYIFDSLAWCGLTPDESIHHGGEYGPYRQSDRKPLYKKFVDQLLESGHAYYAFDTPEELEEERIKAEKQGLPGWQYNSITRQYMKNSVSLPADEIAQKLASGEPHVVRIKVPRNEDIKINDVIRGWVVFNSSQVDDKVIFKSDGMPTYHMANVVDDHLMKISHVIRGEEWLPSTPIHVLLYRFLGWEETMPQFVHLPLIMRPDGKGKLSKRAGDQLGIPVFTLPWKNPEGDDIFMNFKDEGFLPEAFINTLALLGWSPGTDQEVFTLDELIEHFSLDRIGKSGARFDLDKAKWFNQQFIKIKADAELVKMVEPILESNGVKGLSCDYLLTYTRLFKERVVFMDDFWNQGKFMFQDPAQPDLKMLKKKWKPERESLFSALMDTLNALKDWNHTEIEPVFKTFMETHQLGMGDVLPVFRMMISGETGGPPLYELAELMGREVVISRMQKSITQFNEWVKE